MYSSGDHLQGTGNDRGPISPEKKLGRARAQPQIFDEFFMIIIFFFLPVSLSLFLKFLSFSPFLSFSLSLFYSGFISVFISVLFPFLFLTVEYFLTSLRAQRVLKLANFRKSFFS